jgi:hypothetical protein
MPVGEPVCQPALFGSVRIKGELRQVVLTSVCKAGKKLHTFLPAILTQLGIPQKRNVRGRLKLNFERNIYA